MFSLETPEVAPAAAEKWIAASAAEPVETIEAVKAIKAADSPVKEETGADTEADAETKSIETRA